MPEQFRIEQSSTPGFLKFVSLMEVFPASLDFPSRLSRVKFPGGQDDSIYASFSDKSGMHHAPLSLTRWKLEWSDNYIYYNPFLEGKEDLAWLAQRNTDKDKGTNYGLSWSDIPAKKGSFIKKPTTSRISDVLSQAVRVLYRESGTHGTGQQIYFQSSFEPRPVFWYFVHQPGTDLTDDELEKVLQSFRWERK